MSWFVLVVSGMLEAVWAAALSESRGLRRAGPAVLFALALIASLGGLAYAMNTIPTGTAYAVWVGIGAALTAGYAMATGKEPARLARILLLLLLVGSVVGLKAMS